MPLPIKLVGSPHFDCQDFSQFAFGNHLEGSATDLAIGRKALDGNTRINHQLKGLPTIGALYRFLDFHTNESQPCQTDAQREWDPLQERLLRLEFWLQCDCGPIAIFVAPQRTLRGSAPLRVCLLHPRFASSARFRRLPVFSTCLGTLRACVHTGSLKKTISLQKAD